MVEGKVYSSISINISDRSRKDKLEILSVKNIA